MRWPTLSIALVTIAAVASSCSSRLPSSPDTSRSGTHPDVAVTKSRPVSIDGPQHIEGVIGPGALYALDVPADWNGDLVLYMHGIKPTFAPVELPGDFEDFNQILAMLLERGYAVAHSSFSENGYAVAEGVRQTHQLSGIVASKIGQPRQTLLLGQSLGGIVGLKLAEKYPRMYAGALFVCGVLGGSRAEVDYLAHVRVVFDYFYPNVLGGDLFHVPDQPYDPNHVVGAILADGGSGLGAMARLKQIQLPYDSPEHLVESAATALGVQWVGSEDFYDRAHRHSLFDNENVRYEALAPGLLPEPLLADLNARVARWSATPDAEAWLRHNYEPTGDLRIPVLAIHTAWDPVVPFFHEDLYRDKVAATGQSRWLLQRKKLVFGHRSFAPEEIVEAFDDLAGWVQTGVKPAS